jgi:hypothetical protein
MRHKSWHGVPHREGKHLFITCRRGGNQGKKERLKYDILDISPAP